MRRKNGKILPNLALKAIVRGDTRPTLVVLCKISLIPFLIRIYENIAYIAPVPTYA